MISLTFDYLITRILKLKAISYVFHISVSWPRCWQVHSRRCFHVTEPILRVTECRFLIVRMEVPCYVKDVTTVYNEL